jgi:hypothetical protein
MSGQDELGKALLLHCMNADLKKLNALLNGGLDPALLQYKNNVRSTYIKLRKLNKAIIIFNAVRE